MSFNPLKVSLENIIPLTEARDHFSQIVNEVQKDKLYVLTKGGKPAVAIVDVKYLEHITGGEAKVAEVKEEIEKAPEKVGLPPMVKHDEPKTDYTAPKPYPSTPPPPKTTPQPTSSGMSPTGGATKTDFSAPKPYPSAPPPPKTTPTPPSPMTSSVPPKPTTPSPMATTTPTPPKPAPTPPSPMTSPNPTPTPPKPADTSSFIETTAGGSTNQADKKPGSLYDNDNRPASSFVDKKPAPASSNSTIDVSVMPDGDDIEKDQKAAAAAIDRTNPDDKPGPASYTGANDAHEEPDDMVID